MPQDPHLVVPVELHTALKKWALDNGMKLQLATVKVVQAGLATLGVQTMTTGGEETIWGPVTRVDLDGTRWIRTEHAGEVEESVLRLIPEGDVVWEASVQMARAMAAQTAPAEDEDDDGWMADLAPNGPRGKGE